MKFNKNQSVNEVRIKIELTKKDLESLDYALNIALKGLVSANEQGILSYKELRDKVLPLDGLKSRLFAESGCAIGS
jgi:hypothetical protein